MNALVPTVVDEPMDFTVIATSPKDMEAGQRSLILWAARKIQSLKVEHEDAAAQLALHREKKWSMSGWQSLLLKLDRRMVFYRKIKAALEAGYYVVPPFPVDLFAIRVNRSWPNRYDSTHSDNHDQQAQILPVGEGRYVDPKPERRSYNTTESQVVNRQTGESKDVAVRYHYASAYADVDFPFKLARAEIREATDQAMSLRIFDQFGVLPRVRKPDPIIVGQILLPGKKAWRGTDRDSVTFFVAWWLDTKLL